MLGQVLWRQIVYQLDVDHQSIERGTIPQGTLVLVIAKNPTADSVTIIYNEMILVVSSLALKMINSEEDVIPLEVLKKQFHNNRNSPSIIA